MKMAGTKRVFILTKGQEIILLAASSLPVDVVHTGTLHGETGKAVQRKGFL